MSKLPSRKRGKGTSPFQSLAAIPRLARHSATYAAPREAFLSAAQVAAGALDAPKSVKWHVDGWKSDKLFLRLAAQPTALAPGALDAEFDLEATEETMTISVLTRLPSEVTFFERFTRQLDLLLTRSEE